MTRRVLGVPVGPRKVAAAVAVATVAALLGASYWWWGVPALIAVVAAVQVATMLVVAKSQADRERALRASEQRVRRAVDKRLRAATDQGGELTRSLLGAVATKEDLDARAEELRGRLDQSQQAIGELEERLSKWREKDERKVERSRRRVEKDRDADFRQIEALAGLYFDMRPRAGMPPTRGWTASPDLLRYLYGVVRASRPERVLECGSGVSTLVIAYALERNGAGTVRSLEHLPEHADETIDLLCAHDLAAFADVRHAPLEPVKVPTGEHEWYALDAVGDGPYDLVLVDGPPKATQEQARYPALPVLRDRLSERAAIIVDDHGRPDEREVVEQWLEEFPDLELTSLRHEKGTAVLSRGGAQGPGR